DLVEVIPPILLVLGISAEQVGADDERQSHGIFGLEHLVQGLPTEYALGEVVADLGRRQLVPSLDVSGALGELTYVAIGRRLATAHLDTEVGRDLGRKRDRLGDVCTVGLPKSALKVVELGAKRVAEETAHRLFNAGIDSHSSS